MGDQLVKWALSVAGLSEGEKLLLVIYAEAAKDTTRICWPGDKSVSELLEVTERTVERRRDTLKARGLVSVSRRRVKGVRRPRNQIEVLCDLPDRTTSGRSERATRQSERNHPTTDDDLPDATLSSGLYRGTSSRNQKGGTSARERTTPSPDFSSSDFGFATAVLEAFNDVFRENFSAYGTTCRPTSYLRNIAARLVDHPELKLADLRLMLERNARAPWWREQMPTPDTIFGNQAKFVRSLESNGIPDSGRTVRRSIDRSRAWTPGEKEPF
jgi:hypothetical protein